MDTAEYSTVEHRYIESTQRNHQRISISVFPLRLQSDATDEVWIWWDGAAMELQLVRGIAFSGMEKIGMFRNGGLRDDVMPCDNAVELRASAACLDCKTRVPHCRPTCVRNFYHGHPPRFGPDEHRPVVPATGAKERRSAHHAGVAAASQRIEQRVEPADDNSNLGESGPAPIVFSISLSPSETGQIGCSSSQVTDRADGENQICLKKHEEPTWTAADQPETASVAGLSGGGRVRDRGVHDGISTHLGRRCMATCMRVHYRYSPGKTAA